MWIVDFYHLQHRYITDDQGRKDLHFDEMMMMSVLYKMNKLSIIVLMILTQQR